MRINYQRNHIGMLAVVFSLMGVTLYMAFAFPYSLLHFKQSETTELKAVIIVGRHGEVTASRESYFDALGEQPPDEWFQLGGPNQLTGIGKERMFLLGKFLKLRYYERLLAGNPRKLYARSENSDRSLESAQALLAGLNPPRERWIWSRGGADSVHEFAASWQPKAVHTTQLSLDDLLGSQSKCVEMDTLRASWKNSSRYTQLLNEFRHDLQMLRQNTGLELEDDLEMAANIQDQLAAREASDSSPMPAWYSGTLAQRLAYIADMTGSCRFGQTGAQRLFAGRLLDTIVKNIFSKIRSDLTAGISLLNDLDHHKDDSEHDDASSPSAAAAAAAAVAESLISFNGSAQSGSGDKLARGEELAKSKLMPPEEQLKLKLERQNEPNMFIYITDKQHLSALMNSLKIYAGQPHYGATLIIELHYDPINQIHFLRLFLVNSASYNVLPEPVRVNPIACLDSVECSPQRFEQNTRHLALDKQSWASLCSNLDNLEHNQQSQLQQQQQQQQHQQLTSTLPPVSNTDSPSTLSPTPQTILSSTETYASSTAANNPVGPTERSDSVTTTSQSNGSINETTTTSTTSNNFDITHSIHLDKLDESLVVRPITTTTSEPANINESTSSSEQDLESTTELPTSSKSPITSILTEGLKTTTTTATTQTSSTKEPLVWSTTQLSNNIEDSPNSTAVIGTETTLSPINGDFVPNESISGDSDQAT